MPGWNPINSAASGAALAGLLAALVIAVSIQIAVQVSRDERDHYMSLKASAPTLVVLMVAAYLYVVLDGIPSTSDEVTDAWTLANSSSTAPSSAGVPEQSLSSLPNDYAHLAARGFAISGSVLAVGALMTLFMVASAIFDNTGAASDDEKVSKGDAEARAWALGVFRAAIVTIVLILATGYRVGISTVGRTVGWEWWFWQVLGLSAPSAVVATWVIAGRTSSPRIAGVARRATDLATRVRKQARETKEGWPWPTVAILFVAAAPAVATLLIVTAGPDHSRAVSLDVTIVASGWYYGITAGFLMWLMERRSVAR